MILFIAYNVFRALFLLNSKRSKCVHFSKNMSYKGTDKGKARKKGKQRYLPKGILFVNDVQELFEYLTISPQSVFLVIYAQK